MSLKQTLVSITGVEQLPALAVELGFAATWHPLAWSSGRPALAARSVVLVGRRGEFLALGEESTDPPRGARRLATSASHRGLNALVLSVNPTERLLSVSTTGVDCPVATIDLDRVRAIDERILERGRTLATASPFETSLAWAEAIAGQSIGHRFFTEFRRFLISAREELPRTIPSRDRHGLALLALSRVLFLYFVQERGWLDGRNRFLREELDRCLTHSGGVDRRLLRPLFFGTLNRPSDRRSTAVRAFGRIPFLNGGLFEPHPLERRWSVALTDRFWTDAFDQLFERFHFTIAETPDDTAIGPDMLGRVFEGVMDPEERGGTGTFYTPTRLVRQVVGRTIDGWLAAQQRPRAEALIRGITVLDPAVGSGVFLMGALERLVALRATLGEPANLATRAVVTTNLYGVDLNPNAVRLAELRLWLAVIQADPDDRPEAIAPLPNLDALVRQGDSVIEPVVLPFAAGRTEAAEVAALRRVVVQATGPAKRSGLVALRKAELRAAKVGIEAAVAVTQGRIDELKDHRQAPGLFGDEPVPSAKLAATLTALRNRRNRLKAMERRLADADELPWFHYHTQFADVMTAGGFDLVIGNPPWIRAEALAPAMRESLKARYRWFRGSGSRGFRHLPDLSVAFLERATELVRPGGAIGMLLPVKLLTAQYGAVARAALAAHTTLEVVAPLDERASGFDATVYPMALIARRVVPGAGHHVATVLGSDGGVTISQTTLTEAPWRVGGKAMASLWDAAARHPTIADRFGCRLGLKTGANDIFIDREPVTRAATRLAIRGRDIIPFRATPSARLLWTHDQQGAPLPRLAAEVEALLHPHRARLRRRSDYRDGPYWCVFRVEAATARHRVAWSDLARRLSAVALVGAPLDAAIPLNTCYWVSAPDDPSALALAAWLNSRPIAALARSMATVAASGFRRFNADTVGRLPLPIEALGDSDLRQLGKEAHRTGTVDEARLDRRVGILLGLGEGDWGSLDRLRAAE